MGVKCSILVGFYSKSCMEFWNSNFSKVKFEVWGEGYNVFIWKFDSNGMLGE